MESGLVLHTFLLINYDLYYWEINIVKPIKLNNMLRINKVDGSNVIFIKANKIIRKEDYQKLDPLVEQKARNHGKIRMLIDIGELDGVLLSAFWEDLKMSVNHASDFEKVAFVGTHDVERIITKTLAPLVNSEVGIFKRPQSAKKWILDS